MPLSNTIQLIRSRVFVCTTCFVKFPERNLKTKEGCDFFHCPFCESHDIYVADGKIHVVAYRYREQLGTLH
jgi:hypothetical protein